MEVVCTRRELRERLQEIRGAQPQSRLALIPTMGYLHEGHLELLRQARTEAKAELTAVSIFVNPLQFNDPEDYEKYPVDLERDLQLARDAGANLVFVPKPEEMYPEQPWLRMSMPPLDEAMEGAFRPGHFEGVLIVVARLFQLFQPDFAMFGKKDYQQYRIIQRMSKDLDMQVEVVGVDTVRAQDGLALSSRNARLNERQREHAALIPRALRLAQQEYRDGERDPVVLKEIVRDVIETGTANRAEYVELARVADLQPATDRLDRDERYLILLAVNCEGVRLIDNVELDRPI